MKMRKMLGGEGLSFSRCQKGALRQQRAVASSGRATPSLAERVATAMAAECLQDEWKPVIGNPEKSMQELVLMNGVTNSGLSSLNVAALAFANPRDPDPHLTGDQWKYQPFYGRATIGIRQHNIERMRIYDFEEKDGGEKWDKTHQEAFLSGSWCTSMCLG